THTSPLFLHDDLPIFRKALGFDQILICVSGSAPISPEIIRFFYGIGLEILEGYGLTETTAPATFNRPGEAKFGTVGVPLPGVERSEEHTSELQSPDHL